MQTLHYFQLLFEKYFRLDENPKVKTTSPVLLSLNTELVFCTLSQKYIISIPLYALSTVQ